jgi:hypothetical protein
MPKVSQKTWKSGTEPRQKMLATEAEQTWKEEMVLVKGIRASRRHFIPVHVEISRQLQFCHIFWTIARRYLAPDAPEIISLSFLSFISKKCL